MKSEAKAILAGFLLGILTLPGLIALQPRKAEATPFYSAEIIKQYAVAQAMGNSGTVAAFTNGATFADGSAGTPSIAFTSDADGSGTGIYRSAANELSIATNGVQRLYVGATGTTTMGTAVASSLTVSSSSTTGVGSSSVSKIVFNGGTGYVEVMANNPGTGLAAFIVNTSGALSGTDKLLSLKANSVEKAYVDLDGAIVSGSTKTRGTITLSGSTGTATVLSGAKCVCQNTAAAGVVKCTVATTTLTATAGTGTGATDTIDYHCL